MYIYIYIYVYIYIYISIYVYIYIHIYIYIYLPNLIPTFFWGGKKNHLFFPRVKKTYVFFKKNLCFSQYTYISNVLGKLCGYRFDRVLIKHHQTSPNIIKTPAQCGPKPGPGDAPAMVNLNIGINLRLRKFREKVDGQ